MASEKLRKYLAYYRKALREDPENIEARLRLAALFRQMGRPNHAIEEYGTAAKLLASDGLPLEAIAACKAILELDPSHQDTQLFLAKLYAEVPQATDDSVRVARPVEPKGGGLCRRRRQTTGSTSAVEEAKPKRTISSATLDEPGLDLPSSSSGRPDTLTSVESNEIRENGEITRVERPRPATDAPESGVDSDQCEETTKVQSSRQQAKLRAQAAFGDDRESIELDVFDMDSLGLDEASSDHWDDLEAIEEFDEPETEEFVVDEDEDSYHEQEPPVRREFRISTLPNIPLFSQLPREVFIEVLDAMEVEQLEGDTEIIHPDDPASCLYVIVEGDARVEKDLIDGRTIELATMGEGEVFGEFRLLTGRGGRARVVAETDIRLFAVRDEVVYRLGREHPKLWNILWGFYYERMLNHALATSPLLETLDSEERAMVSEYFERGSLDADTVLFERGEAVDELSVIVKGSVRVEVPDDEEGQQQDWKIVDTLREGAFIGISPCTRQLPATATVRARTDVVVYRMEGEIFRDLMYGLPEVAEAVRELIDVRQARTPALDDNHSASDRV